jgi:hypothetical protein
MTDADDFDKLEDENFEEDPEDALDERLGIDPETIEAHDWWLIDAGPGRVFDLGLRRTRPSPLMAMAPTTEPAWFWSLTFRCGCWCEVEAVPGPEMPWMIATGEACAMHRAEAPQTLKTTAAGARTHDREHLTEDHERPRRRRGPTRRFSSPGPPPSGR